MRGYKLLSVTSMGSCTPHQWQLRCFQAISGRSCVLSSFPYWMLPRQRSYRSTVWVRHETGERTEKKHLRFCFRTCACLGVFCTCCQVNLHTAQFTSCQFPIWKIICGSLWPPGWCPEVMLVIWGCLKQELQRKHSLWVTAVSFHSLGQELCCEQSNHT